jgi:protein-S-isoprenylcysteine O-methyltransferase Ste14
VNLRGRLRSWLLGPSPVSWGLFAKAVVVAGLIIGLIVWGLLSLGSLAYSLTGLPSTVGLPIALRILGGVILAGGIGLAAWLFRYRSPVAMITSTYFTFLKMFHLAPVSQLGGRTEPLVVQGPQKIVRNPLYLAAIAVFLGWDLANGAVSSLLGVLFLIAWLRIVQIPFEEKELRAIFGEQFVRYSASVPMLIPFTNRKIRKRLIR